MNTHDIEIKLPPLPPGYKSYEFPDGGYDGDEMRTYALVAIKPYEKRIAELEAQIEADRKRRGEPVAYIRTISFENGEVQRDLVLASAAGDLSRYMDFVSFEPLYLAAPQPAEPNGYVGVSLRDIKVWRNEWLEANDPRDGTDCVTPFDEYLYDQPAEPVKYWLCCGSTDLTHADRKKPDCYDPDKAKFGTAEIHKEKSCLS